jgi:flavin reductase (DIM6/NTAB) family NADH-FMN oxidoreductase RutF
VFYETASNHHGLPHDPFKAIVAPRPIGWISSLGVDGAVNLAPYSFFNAFSSRPPLVGFSSEGRKDSVSNIAETREFVCNLATFALRNAMNATSAPLPRGQSEFDYAGLEMSPSRLVKAPRVKASPVSLECKLVDIIDLKDSNGTPVPAYLVLGHVVGIHIDETYIVDGKFDIVAAGTIARCGYADYVHVDDIFSITRPTRA